MVRTIREIGLFMIAAQAVVHFAPGRQYERYIKSISSVIILLLFLKPFLQIAGTSWEGAETILKSATELTAMSAFPEAGQVAGVGDAVVMQAAEEIRSLLDRELEGDDYYVKRVSVRLEEGGTQEGEETPFVGVVIGKREEQSLILVEEIRLGEGQDALAEEETQAYRRKFAVLLGLPEERVEVRTDGRG